ncbi:uncharacterized protein SAPINGB_P004406 [Magnusiomyces paraingens]|uniref:Deoxyhypusine hydroxylase n=1 Tax=Magnusiomyces paraingens TaxID=2606893 RepID=A0A5E8BTN0_9ASCO|nr:uncharacterized protein SAPINGB_P004406 [Saprochaete ingens]VVT55058.1 unnamed protein product [Saprochaete ingens]
MDELRQVENQGETLGDLRAVLLNLTGDVPLAHRFRALFNLKGLGHDGNNQAIDIIAEGFGDESELLKHELAYVLGQTKNLYSATPLRSVLGDAQQPAMVRHEAAEALGALGDKDSLNILKEYLNDPLEVIRQTCELAIERIAWENSEAAKRENLEKSAFTSIDPAPPLPSEISEIPKLKELLNDQSESLFKRYRAMFRLRDIATTDAVLALASGFNDPSALFRHEIAYVFGQLCDPASVPALITVLSNEKEEGMVRHEAAEALGSIATDDVLPILNKFAKDNERVVRESALVALDMYEFENSDQIDYTVVPPVSN